MKPPILTVITLAAALSFSACDQRNKPRQKPTAGPKLTPPTSPYDTDVAPPDERVEKRHEDVVDGGPAIKSKIPPAPETPRNPEYGIKLDGRPGLVKSPYDVQGRPIDVRGLPPGTEVECPYTHRNFLVPP